MPSVIPSCICSHTKDAHDVDTLVCREPTGKCECTKYAELCPACRHGQYSHDGTNGVCTRTVVKTRMPCGCTQYPTPEPTPEEGS